MDHFPRAGWLSFRAMPPHYRSAQPSPAARAASAALPGYIVGASDWLRSIWQDRAAFADKPALILWGLKDIAFRRKELEPWTSALREVEIREFEDCGHFLAEEAPGSLVEALRSFLRVRRAVATPSTRGSPTGMIAACRAADIGGPLGDFRID